MKEEGHVCEFYKGLIQDVTVRKNTRQIYCRRCGQTLQEYEIDPKTLKEIKYKFENKK